MRSGIRVGIRAGVSSGINPAEGGGGGARAFPADAAEWDAAFPSVTTPTAIWTCQEAATPLVDGVGAVDLAQSTSPLFQQAGDPTGRLAVGLDLAADCFLAAAAASLDIDAVTSLSLLVRFAAPAVGGSARGIVGKRQSSGGNGYGIDLTATGLLRGFADGGVAQQGASIATPVHDDGQWHDALMVIDRGANTVSITSELGTASASIAAVGTLTSTQVVRLLGDGTATAHVGLLVSYLAIWVGAVLDADDLTTFRAQV